MRGVSTVVDATVFLLLVGGSVATLVAGTGAIPQDGHDPAGTDARILATSTATVNYTLAPAAESSVEGVDFPRTEGADFRRRAHGTLASLLGDAAVANAGVAGEQFSHASDDFEQSLREHVCTRICRPGVRTSVVAVWRPYPDAPVRGQVQAGDDPPRDADVHASTVTVDSGIPASGERAHEAASEEGYPGVARVVAEAVVRGLLPPERTRLALRGDYPEDTLTVQRYRRTADALGSKPPRIVDGDVRASNDRLARALARRLESDLRERYESPSTAAKAIEIDDVRVVVRTWSP